MMVDIDSPLRVAQLGVAAWSSAEILDIPLHDDLRLRALVCRLGVGQWQWSISSLDGGERGELISAGVERTAIAARQTATVEIGKCLEDALA